MRSVFATIGVALVALIAVGGAQALTTVNVRIEGKEETLFEGRVATDPHGVRAASDRIAPGKLRRCDGINVNDPQNTVPGVTATAASADAMSLIGETFDGQWYKQYEDYFVTRWGPDGQDVGANSYWGILVDDTYTNVGGCQYQLDDGDEVLWVYDGFKGRPELALLPQSPRYESGPRPQTVTVAPGTPVPVEVVSYADGGEGVPGAGPSRAGSSPLEGAAVASVATDGKGFERVESSTPIATTGPGGTATLSFTQPGWHRIKATVGTPGLESVIRSNRLDVCVTGAAGTPSAVEGVSSCDQLPPADTVRSALPTVGEIETEGAAAAPAAKPSIGAGGSSSSPPAPGSLQVSVPRLDRAKVANGTVGIDWSLISAGPGVKVWKVDSLTLHRKAAVWTTRASGATKTKATVHLPKGHTYKLRFRITDARGETSIIALGKVRVPAGRNGGGNRK